MMTRYGWMVVAGAAVLLVAGSIGWTRGANSGTREKGQTKGATERGVTSADVPAAALATLKKMADGAEITAFSEETEHGHTFYEGSWKSSSGTNIDVLVTPTGDLVETEQGITIGQVPMAVQKAIRKAAGKGTELAFEKKTSIQYEVTFQKRHRRHELLLTPDGRYVEKEISQGNGQGEEEEESR